MSCHDAPVHEEIEGIDERNAEEKADRYFYQVRMVECARHHFEADRAQEKPSRKPRHD
jgi:hypothetical protein